MATTSSVRSISHLSSSFLSTFMANLAHRRLSGVASHVRGGPSSSSTGASTGGPSGKKKIVVCRDLGDKVMPLLYAREDFEIVAWPEESKCDRPWLLKNLPGASGVLLMLSEKVNDELLDAAGPNLRVVSTMSVGYEHVDQAAVKKRGVRVGYTPDVLTDAVADISVMLALMASRTVGPTMVLVQEGKWPSFSWSPFAFCGPQLSLSDELRNFSPHTPTTRTVGFLGFGRIAKATLARLVPFGITHCIYTSSPRSVANPDADAALATQFGIRSVQRVSLDELARDSDVVFVLAPGGEDTRHVVNEAFLRKMKKTGVLVNTSRGTLVDSDALAKALREEWIYAAGLDVVEGEPDVRVDHPLVKDPRCIVLPHIGSATLETRLGMATLAANNLLAGVDGQPMPAELRL